MSAPLDDIKRLSDEDLEWELNNLWAYEDHNPRDILVELYRRIQELKEKQK